MPELLLSLMSFMVLTGVLYALRTHKVLGLLLVVWVMKLLSMVLYVSLLLPRQDISASMGVNMGVVIGGCILIVAAAIGFPSWWAQRVPPVWISREPQ